MPDRQRPLAGIHETAGPAETEALGARLAKTLRRGDVVLLSGELGAGKTTLVRGACRALGVHDPVTSPTFSLAHRYAGRLPVAHLDLYRLGSVADEEPGLIADELAPDGVSFVEWPEAGGDALAPGAGRVHLAHAGGERRRIEIHAPA